MITQIIIGFLVLFIGILGASVGVLFSKRKGRELKGSCGGPEVNPDCCKTRGETCPKENLDP